MSFEQIVIESLVCPTRDEGHRVLTAPGGNLSRDTLSPYPVFFLSSPLFTTALSIYLVFVFLIYFPLLECKSMSPAEV